MSVYNVYFCGSGNYYGKATVKDKLNDHINSSLLIQNMYDSDTNERWSGKILLDGPSAKLGSGVKKNIYAALKLIGGDIEEVGDVLEGLLSKRVARKNKMSLSLEKQALAKLTPPSGFFAKRKSNKANEKYLKDLAKSYKDNLQHEVDCMILPIMKCINLRSTVTVVNMVGFSRGGVSCFLLANLLHKHFPNIAVNVVALDPVPGGTHKFKSGNFEGLTYKKLESNVAQYLGIYARDEYRKGFSALIPELKDVGASYITDVPGRHGTVGTGRIDTGKNIHGEKILNLIKIPFIVSDFVKRTMQANGANYRGYSPAINIQLVSFFDTMHPPKVYNTIGRKKGHLFFKFGRRSKTSSRMKERSGDETVFHDFSKEYDSDRYICKYHEDLAESNDVLGINRS